MPLNLRFRIVEALIKGETYDLADDIQQMRELREDERLGLQPVPSWKKPSSAKYLDPPEQTFSCSTGIWNKPEKGTSTVASSTSSIAVEIACDKEETKNLLEAASVPVPSGRVCMMKKILKPREAYRLSNRHETRWGNHGRGQPLISIIGKRQ